MVDQENHFRELCAGRGPVKSGAACGVYEKDSFWVVVKLVLEQLCGLAKDDAMDLRKLLFLNPIPLCARWVQRNAVKLWQLLSAAFSAKYEVPCMLIRTRLGRL